MAAGSENSRIGIQFGEHFQEGKAFFHLNLDFSKEGAGQLADEIKQKTNNLVGNPEWKVVVAISYEAENKQKLIDIINSLSNEPQSADSELHAAIFEIISSGQVTISHHDVDGKIYLVISAGGPLEEELKAPFLMFFDQGLSELAASQKNTVSVDFATNSSIDEIIKSLDEDERFVSAALQNAKIEILAQIHKDFGQKLTEIVSQIEPDLANIPPIKFLKYFRSLDIDLNFISTQELPEAIRKKLLPGKAFQEASKDIKSLKPDMDTLLFSIIESFGQNVEVSVVVPDFLAIKIQGFAPLFSKFIKNYGGYMINIGL